MTSPRLLVENDHTIFGGFPKLGVPFLGVPILRDFGGIYLGPIMLGNCHLPVLYLEDQEVHSKYTYNA